MSSATIFSWLVDHGMYQGLVSWTVFFVMTSVVVASSRRLIKRAKAAWQEHLQQQQQIVTELAHQSTQMASLQRATLDGTERLADAERQADAVKAATS